MIFTDDDLKRLKGWIKTEDDFYANIVTVHMTDLEALLARLEAAEEALMELYSFGAPIMKKGKNWRKAVGK